MATGGEKYVGKNLAISVAGVTLDQTVVRSFTLNESHDVHDSTGGGGGAKTYLGGETNATCTFELWQTDVDSDVRDNFPVTNDSGLAVIVYPQGNSSGEVTISFSMLVASIDEGIDKNATTPLTVNGQVTGAITRSTVS